MTGRTLNELQEFKLEPRAAALAAHLVNVLRGDRAQFLFVDFYPAVRCGLRWCNARALSAGMAEVARVGGPLAHDQSPMFWCLARNGCRDGKRSKPPASRRLTVCTVIPVQ